MDPVYQAAAGLLASQPSVTFGAVDLIAPPPVDPRVYQRVLLDSTLMHDALMRLDGVDRDAAAMKAFQRRVRVSVENQEISSVIHIEVRDSSPDRAAAYANVLAEALIGWDRNRAREMVTNSITALERSISDIDAEIATTVVAEDAASAQRLQVLGAKQREQRVRELESARALSVSAVVVGLLETLSVAQPPAEAIGPRLVFNVFVALILGLIFGYSVQFLRWSSTNGVTNRRQLEELGAQPVLAEFPKLVRGGHRLAPDLVGFFRARLLQAVRNQHPLVFGITSPASYGEKAGVAVSLADGLARGGLRTLLIDADLRREGPGFGLELGRTQTPSFDMYLKEPAMAIQPVTVFSDAHNSFDVLPTRAPVKYPSEMLSYGFATLIEHLGEAYDAIVVDLPPALTYADALTAATACTGVVIAVGVGSNGALVAETVELLEAGDVRLLGAVLTGNAPAVRKRSYGIGVQRRGDVNPPPSEAPAPKAVARVKSR